MTVTLTFWIVMNISIYIFIYIYIYICIDLLSCVVTYYIDIILTVLYHIDCIADYPDKRSLHAAPSFRM
jgi:cobalamin synthase